MIWCTAFNGGAFKHFVLTVNDGDNLNVRRIFLFFAEICQLDISNSLSSTVKTKKRQFLTKCCQFFSLHFMITLWWFDQINHPAIEQSNWHSSLISVEQVLKLKTNFQKISKSLKVQKKIPNFQKLRKKKLNSRLCCRDEGS